MSLKELIAELQRLSIELDQNEGDEETALVMVDKDREVLGVVRVDANVRIETVETPLESERALSADYPSLEEAEEQCYEAFERLWRDKPITKKELDDDNSGCFHIAQGLFCADEPDGWVIFVRYPMTVPEYVPMVQAFNFLVGLKRLSKQAKDMLAGWPTIYMPKSGPEDLISRHIEHDPVF